MRRLDTAIIAICCFFSSPFAANAEFRSDTILSVTHHEDVILASTRVGLFRSSPHQRQWMEIALPMGVKSGGCLSRNVASVSPIYYSPPWEPVTARSDRCGVGFGLWVSQDVGKTWSEVDRSHFFKSVFVQGDQQIYAPGRALIDKDDSYRTLELVGGQAMVSRDEGHTWDETRPDPIPAIVDFQPCKDPTHVCANGWSIRRYSMEYAPETKKWMSKRTVRSLEEAPIDPDQFLLPTMATGTSPCCYMYRATLENYYEGAFGDALQRVGVAIEADEKRYAFSGKPGVIGI